MNHRCYLISNKPQFIEPIRESFIPAEFEFFDGSNFDSFSQLVNTCVSQCPTETVVMMSDKVRPKIEHLSKTLSLLEDGYGFVGLYRLGFFGLKKELFRRIGMMDERFIRGWFEDDDLYTRIQEANIAMYLSEEVEYLKSPGSWVTSDSRSKNREFCIKKWGSVPKSSSKAKRNLPELKYNYDLGKSIPIHYKTWNETHIEIMCGPFKNLKSVKIL